MKKHGIVRLILVLAIIGALGVVLPVYAQEKETAGFKIARFVVGTGVEDREPVGVAEVFPASTEKVYCFLEATSIEKDTEISFVWFHGQKEMLKFSLPLKMGSRWRTYAHKNLGGLKGEWKVELQGPDRKVLKEVKFKVE
ncbi:MAG: DUF2914 domain-containing protein [Syntrophaceae bacterium]|nr:DUF2914 domain-containing protein [Syntrophaceae bacterium]